MSSSSGFGEEFVAVHIYCPMTLFDCIDCIASMPFYHFMITIVPREGSNVQKFKIHLEDSMLLRGALLLVGSKFTTGRPKRSDDDNDDDDDDATSPGERFVLRIKSVHCNRYCLMDSLDFPLDDLDSDSTPMAGKKGKQIEVELNHAPRPASMPSRPRCNASTMLMGGPVSTFLPVLASDEAEAQANGTVQQQLRGAFPAFYADIQLGFFDAKTKSLLTTNLSKSIDILCFINGHWRALFGNSEEPHSSKLLRMTKTVIRVNA
jgi:hypothetical protein